jgi:hypothetical protein
MNWLKIFGIGDKKGEDKGPRLLEHPRDLCPGDMLKFEFSAQAEITNKTFTVEKIWTLVTGEGAHNKRIYFGLVDSAVHVRLRVVDEDQIELAIEVLPEDLLAVFKKQEVIDLLASETGALGLLKTRKLEKVPAQFHSWIAKVYRLEASLISYRFSGNYRNKPVPTEQGSGETGCDFYSLVADDREHSVEFRVFDGGRTEVHLCIVLPRRKIEELWPAAQGAD